MTTYETFHAWGLDQFQESIARWQNENFPGVTPGAAFDRLEQEIEEFGELFRVSPTPRRIEEYANEAADVFIVLVQVCDSLGIDLADAVTAKMNVNLARKWKINPDGTGQHVGEDNDG